MRSRLRLRTLLALLLCGSSGVAFAQVGVERRGGAAPQDPLPVPDYARPAPNSFDQSLLTSPTPGRAATSASFVANEIDVHGVSLLPQAQIDALVAPYLHHDISVDDLLLLRDAITNAYVSRGYINSGAVVPDQDVSDHVIDINVIEGRLTAVEIHGLRHLHHNYVASRINADGLLNRDELTADFARLQQDPNIARVNARLGPGAHPGEAVLSLDVVEAKRWTVQAEAASDRSPSVGGERAILRSVMRDAFGWGDRTALELGATRGLQDAALTFSTPLNANDLALTVELNGSHAEVVEKPLNALDVVSDSYSAKVSVTQPLWRGGPVAGLGLSYMHAQTNLLGQPFSFSPGAVDGETAITVAHATLDYVHQSPRQVFALRSTLSYGLDGLDQPAGAPDELNKNFLMLTAQAQFARATTDSGQQFLARADLQVAPDALSALEQFSFGGIDSVRGYRKNQVLTDNGVVVSLEYRVPLRDLAIGRHAQPTGEPHWVGAAFVDGGYGWNTDFPDPQLQKLASVGASVSWHPNDRVSAEFYAAAQIENAPSQAEDQFQDYGIGFRLTTRLW